MKNNGKMDLVGGKDAWAMGTDKPLSELEKEAVISKINQEWDKTRAEFNKKIDKELEEAQESKKKMETLEIMPMGNYVLVKPYAKNPYERIEEKSGLLIPNYDGSFKNPDTGEDDHMENLSCQGTVIEVGPLTKFLKEGDDIFYRRVQAVPVPFFRQGFEVVAETSVQCVVNEGLKARWEATR